MPKDNHHLTEEFVAESLVKALQPNTLLFCSNSMPIRLMDRVSGCVKDDIKVMANRGASGIDGIISSAIGAAEGSGRPLVLVIGDLAFLHDLNALNLIKHASVPVTIVVINNDGGGIFSQLPIATQTPHFNAYFQTPHGLTFESGAKLFSLGYRKITCKSDFSSEITVRLLDSTIFIVEAIVN